MYKNIINMSVYVAGMNMRGQWAQHPDNCIVINVCSSQSKSSKNRRDFSPMTEYEYKGYWNFEHYWQSGKVFDGLDNDKIKIWWKELRQPKRRYPKSKGKTVLYAKFDHIEENLDYISSRKQVYIPEYYNLVKDREMTLYWKNKVENGTNVVIYDFDGPRLSNGEPTCLLLTEELLIEKMNDTNFPFGHGYIVASILANINILELFL